MTTQENLVAALANNIMGTAAALNSIATSIALISAQWTNLSAANKLNAFPTAPLTTTGGIGTPDVTPVVTNPIDTSVAPGSELNRAISAQTLAGLLTYLQGVEAAINGSAVSANGAAAQQIAQTL